MLINILTHTPIWVFVVFGLLAWMGGRQLCANRSHLYRVICLPLAMAAFGVHGVITAFGHSPAGLQGLAGWATAAALALTLSMRMPLDTAVSYDAAARRFFQPGSWVPLALMMGIFLSKYAIGVLLAFHPQYARQAGFAIGVSMLYGLFSGVFAGRAARLWTLAFRRHAALSVA